MTFEIEIYGFYGSDIANQNKRENTSGFFDIYLKRILGKLPVGSIEIFVGLAGFYCFVLIQLKTGKLTHQDLGQMQMYVNYYTREMMNEGDNLPIGIVLCADKSESVVRYTLPEDNHQIFTSKYKLYLPSEEELRQELQREYHVLDDVMQNETGDKWS